MMRSWNFVESRMRGKERDEDEEQSKDLKLFSSAASEQRSERETELERTV